MAGLQDLVLRHVFRKEEFRSRDGGKGVLDDLEHGIADGFWPVDSSVEVPSTQIQFLGNLVQLLIVERLFGGGVGCSSALRPWLLMRHTRTEESYHDRGI